jgi:hypothetical protein
MNYFVGFPRPAHDRGFETNTSGWLLRPYEKVPVEPGDEASLIGWVRAADSGVLVGHFTVGELIELAAAFEVIPDESFRLPELTIPPDLPDDLRGQDGSDGGRWLFPVDDSIGRELHRISQTYLRAKSSTVSLGRSRAARVTKEKTPEQYCREIERKAKSRLGQGQFRDDLVKAYGGRCAISGCAIDACLSAAHIFDYSQSGCQEAWNGILLRADIHLLFDRHLLRNFPGSPPVVVLSEALQETKTYGRFHLRPLRLPSGFDVERTNRELRRRWEAANRVLTRFSDPPKNGQAGKT